MPKKYFLAIVLICIGTVVGIGVRSMMRRTKERPLRSLETPRSVGEIVANRASAITIDRLEKAASTLKGNARTGSLPFGYYRIRSVVSGNGATRKRNEGLFDEWGNELYVRKWLRGLFVVTAGRDGIPDTFDDVGQPVEFSEFAKVLARKDDLSSPAVRQKIMEAFNRTVGNEKGYNLSITDERGVVVTIEPE